MTVSDVTAIASDALFLIIKVSAPILLVSLIVGLIISIFQTVTSIQEQTLTFVPKIIAVFLTLILLGNWVLTQITEFMNRLWSNFSLYTR
ncbi:MAG: flagellar biosynthesis protein FliQ [Lachnospiraceae bacterium]|nr:flagellar biosynthesis protein FliQ [Lachnospiraceae bacterium]MCI7043088.1 flagellar biosynthesis protein FliQ [Lachnospiraceae bacterium]MCI7191369.1 flagellar biosynthesis protein FliQ [Lachnospiraceae bacterium]MDD7627948.1 flagellar biosynthesis protein FliQ [Lachnospiraceae bacterium]MDY4119729.1 flagellar biosynthesis protein FliQ [Lachnospiraceae bacterium]